MKDRTERILNQFYIRNPRLKDLMIEETIQLLVSTFRNGKKVLVCGNGGSASDALHIVGELMKGFISLRELDTSFQEVLESMYPEDFDYFVRNLQMPLPAISLVNEVSLITAYANDKAADLAFAQQVFGYGKPGDILISISTSGNSNNVVYAAQIAKARDMKVISMTGKNGGRLEKYSDIILKAPSEETFIIQEYHLPVYHAVCMLVESEMFD